MTTFLDSGFERVSRREPASFFSAGSAGLGRFCYGCAVATGPCSAPAAAEYGGVEAGTRQAPTAGVFLDERARAPFRSRVGGAPAGASHRNGVLGPAPKPAGGPGQQGSMAAAVAEEAGRPRTIEVGS